MRFDEHFIRRVCPRARLYGEVPLNLTFAVDSRTIKEGDIFVALLGKNVDGNEFVLKALNQGAAGAIVSVDYFEAHKKELESNSLKDKFFLSVDSPRKALIDLAYEWRTQFAIPIIGITGSVGKTTTKEMVASMLNEAGKSCIVAQGNQNTQIGIALNILRLRREHEVAVFEMGISQRGEMDLLVHLLRPTIGIITAIGHAHVEGLGSLEDIASEKRNIFKYFTEKDIGIINGDQMLLSSVSYSHPVIKIGQKTTNQIQARKVRFTNEHVDYVLKLYMKKYRISIAKPHIFAVFGGLAAAAVGHILSIPHSAIVRSIQKKVTIRGRFEEKVLKDGSGTLISDCYNANPESMKAALVAFERIETNAIKIAVVGDMLELGVHSPFWHRHMGRLFRKLSSVKKVILVGNMVKWTQKTLPLGVEATVVSDWQKACELLTIMTQGRKNLVLVKASRGVGLLHLVDQCTR